MNHPDFVRVNRGALVLDGAFGSTYNVNTVESIDANLASLRHRPEHPDIDRLLDARRLVGVLRTFVTPKVDST